MLAFVGPPKNKIIQVNHINGKKKDNVLENLEYVMPSDNMKHAVENGLLSTTKAIIQYKDGVLINEFYSIAETSRQTNLKECTIRYSCKHPNSKSKHGFKFEYKK